MEQKAVLVGANIDNQDDFEYSMRELSELAAACDIAVVGDITQNLSRANISHYLGTGKIQEVLMLLEETGANIVIFNDELSPSQIRNLERDLQCKVIDRTILILDIFAQRAKTKESQLQVEVAQLQYMLPRLIGLRESLGRQSGGVGMSNKGAGEKALELDRRKIEERIAALNKELQVVVSQRQTQRKQRKKNAVPIVSLVGYTNAGKSTIMNAMLEMFNQSVDKQVFEKDMLFATLETSIRNIQLPDNKSFLLTDTVGFVSKLPHHLVKAFRSTLEEAVEADLLIHVVDCSNPNHKKQIDITNAVLKEIGVQDVQMIYAYNKADLTDINFSPISPDSIYISAKQRIGIDELVQMVRSQIFKDYVQCNMLIPYDKGQLVSYFSENADVSSIDHTEKGTMMSLECKLADFNKYKDYIVE